MQFKVLDCYPTRGLSPLFANIFVSLEGLNCRPLSLIIYNPHYWTEGIMFKTLEEINKMNGDQVSRALELRLIEVNDMDKAVLILGKLHSIGVSQPHIDAKCKNLEKFILTYKG